MEYTGARSVEDVLTLKQVHRVLSHAIEGDWQLLSSEIKPASVGLCGFLGEHYRVTFHVMVKSCVKNVYIFVKSMPLSNKPKASFIDENNYYRREMVMLELFEKMLPINNLDPWYVKAYMCSDKIVVMPDLLYQGYRQYKQLDCLDLKHTLLTTASIARFHAAFANYETKRLLNGQVTFSQEYADVLKEPTFCDSPWLRAAAKLSKKFIAAFSDKCDRYPTNLEEILQNLYIEACAFVTETNSLNVVIHKDLWVNNILFKYEGDSPVNAVLIDFQCIRYSSPAFDLMIFLYLNTSRSFRARYESMILRKYFAVFLENVDDSTKDRLAKLRYDYNEFLCWCDRARMFAMLLTLAIFPYVLMEPALAQKTFDDPETFMKVCNEDRTDPVLAHAKENIVYKERQLEVCEEFVERYVLKE